MNSNATAINKKDLARAKPKIEFKLDDQEHIAGDITKKPTYTTGDKIKGQVTITCQADLPFANIHITLEGACKTYVVDPSTTSATTGRSDEYHPFLRVHQPIKENLWPRSARILEAHKPYIFKFHFVVPSRLPITCVHTFDNISSDAHTTVPSSLGDPRVPTWQSNWADDMTPSMAAVLYFIKCCISPGQNAAGEWFTMSDASVKICICAATEEAPPLQVRGGEHDDFTLRVEKTIKQGSLRGRLGRIVAEAAQPKSFRLPSIYAQNTCPVTTMVTVNLRFDPLGAKEEDLPKPVLVEVKLKVATLFATKPITTSTIKTDNFRFDFRKGMYVSSLKLASRNITNVVWDKAEPAANPTESHSSAFDDPIRIPAPSKRYKGGRFYKTTLKVPLELATGDKVCVPTFDSCLMSRVYSLDVRVAFEQPKATLKDPTIFLKLPIQISSQDNPRLETGRSANQPAAAQCHGQDGVPLAQTPFDDDLLVDSHSPYQNGGESGASDIATNGASNVDASSPPNLPPALQGYTHRASWAPGVVPERAPQVVAMENAQARFGSLSFADEDSDTQRAWEAEQELLPDYNIITTRQRNAWGWSRLTNSAPFRRASTSSVLQ